MAGKCKSDRVIMHDSVWLDPSDPVPADIAEVLSFKGSEILRIHVTQPRDLFMR